MKVRLLAAGVILAATVILGACATKPSPEVPIGPDGRQDPVLVVGREIYQENCVECHGSAGGGGRGEKLSEGRGVEAYPDIDDAIDLVVRGEDDDMPAYRDKLTPEEIEAVVRYTREVL